MNKIIAYIKNHSYTHFWLFLLLATILTTVMMQCYRPICVSADPYFHFNRLLTLMDALRNNTFPWYLDYNSESGFGYFSKAFYSDILLVPYACIGIVTNLQTAYDSLIFTVTLLIAIVCYYSVKRIYNSVYVAIVSSLLYTFSSFFIFELFYFSAVGEVMSYAFIPLVFWGLFEIIKGDYHKWYIISIGFALLICSHVITSVLLFFIVLIFLCIYYKDLIVDKKRIIYLIISGIFCLVMCAYYFIPLTEQLMSNKFYYQIYPVFDSVYSYTTLQSIFKWMTGILNNGDLQNYIPKIGGLLVSALCLRFFITEKSSRIRSVDIGVIVGLLFILINIYLIPWNSFPFRLFSFIQFPYRLIKYSTYFFALAGGYYLACLLKTDKRRIIIVMLISIITILIFRYDSEDYKSLNCRNDLDTVINENLVSQNTTISGAEYLPYKIPSRNYINERGKYVAHRDSNTELSDWKYGNDMVFFFDVKIDSSETLEMPLVYYKGYSATLNGIEIPVKESSNGLVEVSIIDSGKINIWYAGTFLQKISSYISLIAMILLFVYIIRIKRRRGKQSIVL